MTGEQRPGEPGRIQQGPGEQRGSQQAAGPPGTVTVRYWAAARAAAGVAEESLPAATLAELVELLGQRHGPALARVLSYCSFVIDGTPAGGGRRERAGVIAPGEQAPPLPGVDLAPGCVIEVLPPFAGGSSDHPVAAPGATRKTGLVRPPDQRLVAVAAAVLAAAVLAGALEWSRVALAVALVLVQLALALGWTRGLSGGSHLAVLPVLAAVVADGVLLGDRTRAGEVVAAVVGLAFVAALVQQLARQPRVQVTARLATVVAGVFVVTVAALVLPLRELPDGVAASHVTLAGAGVAVVVGRLLPVPLILSHAVGVVAAALVGGLLARGGLSVVEAAGVAAAAALGAAVTDLAVQRAAAGHDELGPAAALSVLPVALAIPLGYLVAHWVAS